MNSGRFKTLIKVAKKHKVKSLQLYKDMVDTTPDKDLKKLIQENIITGERKHHRWLEDMVRDYNKKNHKHDHGCQDREADVKSVIIPLQQGVFISKYYPDKNFNDYDALYFGRHGHPNNVFRTLMQFDLNKIPDNCTIIKAELAVSLCTNELPHGGARVAMHPILTDWCEDTATWNDGPEIAREHWRIEIPGGVFGPLYIDVSDYIQDYFECPNYGFILVGPESIDGVIGIEARDCGPHRKGPYLKIEMECGHDE